MTQEERTEAVMESAAMLSEDNEVGSIRAHARDLARKLDEAHRLIPTFGLTESAERCLRTILESDQ